MVESQLLEGLASQAIHATITHMSNHPTDGQQGYRTRGRPHAAKLWIDHPLAIDLAIGFFKGPQQRLGALCLCVELGVMVWNQFDTQTACKFASSMSPHPIGNDQ